MAKKGKPDPKPKKEKAQAKSKTPAGPPNAVKPGTVSSIADAMAKAEQGKATAKARHDRKSGKNEDSKPDDSGNGDE